MTVVMRRFLAPWQDPKLVEQQQEDAKTVRERHVDVVTQAIELSERAALFVSD